jgi:hypothetical protein
MERKSDPFLERYIEALIDKIKVRKICRNLKSNPEIKACQVKKQVISVFPIVQSLI